MTKEEIANIKRIDTSLNVFRKKIEKIAANVAVITAKYNKEIEPLSEEIHKLNEEIDFWQRPVIDRYGKTTEDILHEEGVETAKSVSDEEDNESISEISEKIDEVKVKDKIPTESDKEDKEESSNEFEAEIDEDLDSNIDLPEEWQ